MTKNPDLHVYEMQNLWEWIDIMHKEINLRDHKKGWFGSKHTKCCLGEEIFNWLVAKGKNEHKNALAICNQLVEQNIIINIQGKTFFVQSDHYKFYFDKDEIADNMVRNWRQEPGDAYEVSIILTKKAEEMYASSIIQDDDGDPVLDVELAMKSQEYKAYINAVCELEKV